MNKQFVYRDAEASYFREKAHCDKDYPDVM